MSLDLHTVSIKKGSSPLADSDRVSLTDLNQFAYAAGGSAGATVTVAVTGLDLPAKYSVLIGDLGQDATAYVTNRTSAGFTLNINPRLAANTLAAGKVDLVVLA